MIAEFMRSPDSTWFAQIALLIFVSAFVAVVARACLLARVWLRRFSAMALED